MVLPLLAFLAAIGGPQWQRTDLPIPRAHPDMFVFSRGVNTHGAAIYGGTFGKSGTHQQAFLWRNGKLTVLTARNEPWVDVNGINDSGTVVGDAGARAVVWRNGTPTVLAKVPSTAQAINNRGTIIGVDQRNVVIWRGGAETQLDTVASVTAINQADQVIGETPVYGTPHAMLWQNDSTTDLGSIGTAGSWATAINDSGDIVGYVSTPLGFPLTAVEWHDGQLIDLGRFGALGAKAVAVNDAGDVLIQLVDDAGNPSAIVLLRDGKPVPVPGVVARTVDAQGQVLGSLVTAQNAQRSFIWSNGKLTLLPTADGLVPPFGQASAVTGTWAIGNEYVDLPDGHHTSRAVLWRRR